MMKKLNILLKKPFYVKVMLVKALVLSGWYRWHILYRPFAEMSEHIGTLQYETPVEPVRLDYVRQVSWVVKVVCRRTAWESMCLVQALTAKKLLNERQIPCTLYMGVGRSEENELKAHAWLRCGNRFVTGGNGALTYAVTTKYGDPWALPQT